MSRECDGRRADLLSPLSLLGYALMPAGRSDLSDSSEISSRSSIVSNGSVDSMPAAPAINVPSETPANSPADCSQPGTSSSSALHLVVRETSFTFSSSAEELTVPEQTSVSELADSGRGSWTSCSSNSHDSLQTLPSQRALDLLNHRHTPMGGPIAEVEIGPGLPEDSCSRDGSELSQSRQSWTSCSSLSDTYKGSYGTVKRKTQDQQSTDASYKTITSSTEKGLIGELQLLRVTPADFTVLSLDDKCAALLARLCLVSSRTLI
ncbi:rap guanine nucleotide exchange factor 6-like [Sinocyclocheilus grahami]|uniref:rap guanine nucleotide exchange factor 6-like n=1 Tax=Sinocyclocheilus grahami TaxID=75366 RepID=UPI0007ACFA65|nr:PREDICTED: rap guanine nucleotide exchange factor 6-like [Sinocyclocheilus grahami]